MPGKCDGIITDRIEMAERLQETQDNRSDMKLTQDKFGAVSKLSVIAKPVRKLVVAIRSFETASAFPQSS